MRAHNVVKWSFFFQHLGVRIKKGIRGARFPLIIRINCAKSIKIEYEAV